MTGIDYPTITIGEHENLTVRLSLAAQLLMRRRGLDPAKIGELMLPGRTVPNPNMHLQTDPPTVTVSNDKAVENVVIVFSCMVAENFLDKSATKLDLNTAPTADYWATRIDDFSAVEKVVWAAVGKAVEDRRKRLAVVPPQEAAS
jgi:hypothetical protein